MAITPTITRVGEMFKMGRNPMGQVLSIATYNMVLPDNYDLSESLPFLGTVIAEDFSTILNVLVGSPLLSAAAGVINLEVQDTYLNSIGYANSVELDAVVSSTGAGVADSVDLSDVNTNLTILGYAKFDQ